MRTATNQNGSSLVIRTAVTLSFCLGTFTAIGAASAASPDWVSVTVASGDTLTRLARKNGVSVADLVALNGLTSADRIFAGQKLRIGPTVAPSAGPIAVPAGAETLADFRTILRGKSVPIRVAAPAAKRADAGASRVPRLGLHAPVRLTRR